MTVLLAVKLQRDAHVEGKSNLPHEGIFYYSCGLSSASPRI